MRFYRTTCKSTYSSSNQVKVSYSVWLHYGINDTDNVKCCAPAEFVMAKMPHLKFISGRVCTLVTSQFRLDQNNISIILKPSTHWGRVTHLCVGKLTIIGSDKDLSASRHQAIIWTNAGILLIRTLGTNIIEILSEIHTLSFEKMHLKMSSAKWWQLCLGLNVLIKRQ